MRRILGEANMKTLEDIRKIREEKKKELDLRTNDNATTREKHILVCAGPRLHIIWSR